MHWLIFKRNLWKKTTEIYILLSKVRICIMLEHEIVIIFLPFSFNMCFGCSKEPSHYDGSFEHPQHIFWMRNKKIFFNYALLAGGVSLIREYYNEVYLYNFCFACEPEMQTCLSITLFSVLLLLRPNKKEICTFWVTGLKILGKVDTHIFY